MTLGEFINALSRLDADLPINGCGIDSYRGYYRDLAIDPGQSTVGALLEECQDAVHKTFQGYKGGDFRMDENTPVWFSAYGRVSSLGIFDVADRGTEAEIVVLDVSDYE